MGCHFVSLMAQTGQSEAIHSPEACRPESVLEPDNANRLINRSGLDRRDPHADLGSCARYRARSTAGITALE